MNYVVLERDVLQILSSCTSHFVRLYCTFQDTERLYFVLTYARNGELLPHITKNGSFSLVCTRYYTAELIVALEVLNSKGIVHRDLKPENILFDENWHILITDFGSAKILSRSENKNEESISKQRKNSFVGTAQYVSPELLSGSEAVFASDLWALGCIIYQMVSGVPPFRAGSEYLIFQKILKLDYDFPECFDANVRNLVEKLLVLVPEKRLGAQDSEPYKSIREHDFFCGFDWNNSGQPPKIAPHAADCSESSKSISEILYNLEPGFDHEKASRLQLEMFYQPNTIPADIKNAENVKQLMNLDEIAMKQMLETQKLSKWHNLVGGNLILRQGIVDKKKGLFSRRRIFFLTCGPHLYYVDPASMVLKGEIPWSNALRAELKSFRTFFIHTVSLI